MDNPFSIDLPQLREMAVQRADGASWQKIAEAYPADEALLRRTAENLPAWDRFLFDARQKAFADAAWEAVKVLQQALQSENEKIRMQAATQILRLHMATMKQIPKAAIGDEEIERRFECDMEPIPEKNGETTLPSSMPAVIPVVTPHHAAAAKGRPQGVRPSGKVDFRRNLLLAPLLSSKGIERPTNGKPR